MRSEENSQEGMCGVRRRKVRVRTGWGWWVLALLFLQEVLPFPSLPMVVLHRLPATWPPWRPECSPTTWPGRTAAQRPVHQPVEASGWQAVPPYSSPASLSFCCINCPLAVSGASGLNRTGIRGELTPPPCLRPLPQFPTWGKSRMKAPYFLVYNMLLNMIHTFHFAFI